MTPARARFRLILDFGPDSPDAIRRLRALLKSALRSFGARAVTIEPIVATVPSPDPSPERNP